MPPVAAAVVAAVSSYAASFSIGSFLLSTAMSMGLSAISRALTPKPKGGNTSFGQSGLTTTVREPLTSRKVIYGQTRVSGPMVFVGGTSDNKYLHMVIVLASHEVQSIDEVWINDYVIPNDWINPTTGLVNQGRYNNIIRIRKYLGGTGQTASPELVSEIDGWTTDHKLSGIAYLYIRMEYNVDAFPGGIPNISAFVRGKKIFDPRVNATSFTTNAALFQYDYLSNSEYGLGAQDDINTSVIQSSANISDEIVDTASKNYTVSAVDTATEIITLSGDVLELYLADRVQVASTGSLPTGLSSSTDYYVIPYQFKDTPRLQLAASFDDAMAGTAINLTTAGSGTITITKTGEPRYHGGGVIDTEPYIEDNLKDLLSATGGLITYVGGKWLIKVAAYAAPTVTLTDDDFIAPISVQTRLSRKDRFNAIKGIFRSILNLDTPSDWPALASTTFAEDDLESIWREYNTPFTQRAQNARRIAKIELLRARQEIAVTAICNLRALQIQCGDNVKVTNARMGWTEKVFEVTNFALTSDGNKEPNFGVKLTLRETDESVYDWNTSEEQDVDPAPNTNLPNAYDVSAVSGVAFNSRSVDTVGGDNFYILSLQWNVHPDTFVTNGGGYEIQFKQSSDSDWKPSFTVPGLVTYSDIASASVGVAFDVRIRAVNNLGVRSSWVTLLGAVAGSGGGVGTTEDWGNFGAGPDTTEDWGDFSSVDTTEDWGAFV